MRDESSNQTWLSTGNIIFAVVSAILLGVAIWMYQSGRQQRDLVNASAKELGQWQKKLDAKVQANSKTIYVTNNSDLHFTPAESNTVTQLTSLFTEMTNYKNPAMYQTAYNNAKKLFPKGDLYTYLVKDPKVFNQFNIKSKNFRTQVLVNGPDSYQVVVTYVWYHDNSDMYSPTNMQTLTDVYNIKGQAGHYQGCTKDKQVNTNAVSVPYSQFSNAGSGY